jgi:hypothetical protein
MGLAIFHGIDGTPQSFGVGDFFAPGHRLFWKDRNSMSASIQAIGREAPTMEFLCSVCSRREGEPQGWQLVIEMAKPGSNVRNTMFILDQWDGKRAQDPNAASFCSTACKDRYLAERHRQLVA